LPEESNYLDDMMTLHVRACSNKCAVVIYFITLWIPKLSSKFECVSYSI